MGKVGVPKMREAGATRAKIRKLLSEGCSNKEISAELDISTQTVSFHVTKLYKEAGLYGPGDRRRFLIWLLSE